ncbi:TIR domain-containing protein [Desulfobacterales bacterium HSG17]|nr:TIR domain-containing protein [Desulfobacterales bacterium HSG17]
MPSPPIFISYSNKDTEFVTDLRQALVSQGLDEPWTDFRQLKAGDGLKHEIFKAIEDADFFMVVVSPNTFNSEWVKKETEFAAKLKKKRGKDFQVIPLLLDGSEVGALSWIFSDDYLSIQVKNDPGGISAAMPEILAALGERLPNLGQGFTAVIEEPVEELLLELIDPEIEEKDGKRRARAMAKLHYIPADSKVREVVSLNRFYFTAPLGPIENEDLAWYLEKYHIWPSGVFRERARDVEKKLPQWGQELYETAMPVKACHNVLTAWQKGDSKAELRFTVHVDAQLPDMAVPDEAYKEKQAQANEAATLLLGLPWELLHDGHGFLFQGAKPVRVRRQLPNRESFDIMLSEPPIRILMVSPRPEDDSAGYFDHRASALPLVQAVESLGKFAELTVLSPPTFAAMSAELQNARDVGKPYHVVHFDGHGIYDRHLGLGGLCFENPNDSRKLEKRGSKIEYAEKLAEVIQDHRIPLFFLDACQTAQSETEPTASVASALLDRGVASVIAMSHSVLVETARRFVASFYTALVSGKRVGKAMLEGQRALKDDTFRAKIFGAGELHMEDWFVPVLFQEKDDPRLFRQIPSAQIRDVDKKALKTHLGNLPDAPAHEL